MAKIKKIYVCSECGYESAKWLGKCPDCASWNSFSEEIRTEEPVGKKNSSPAGVSAPAANVETLDSIDSGEEIRYISGIDELDRVLGGGLVPGSVVLISGDPGIGKSTLMLQMCSPLSKMMRILYVTGEESSRQIKLRALRLGVMGENLLICASNDVHRILSAVEEQRPQLVIVDSIQTMSLTELSSSPGSVSQIRECTHILSRAAKELEIPIFIVGHVNKDGAIAGPKLLEHMVDAVLYFEGERNLSYRILRAIKNRYGSTNEIGVFEMQESGLVQVENPSMMLLSGRPEHVSGTCVASVIEGSRPILAEIQALVCKSGYNVPRRTANGIDFNRAAMLMAVLEKRCGYVMGNLDAYLNVVGGLRLDEPSCDLAVVMALLSNLLDKPLDPDMAAFGEVGLAGEVRAVSKASIRVSEAYRLGFRRIVLPESNAHEIREQQYPGIDIIPVKNIRGLKNIL